MNKTPKIIAITGAESTGKSTLAKQLSDSYNGIIIPEFAREYIENLHRKYTYSDVEFIAKQQVGSLHEAKKRNTTFIFLDTWLIITKVWFELVYQKEPKWLLPELEQTKIDLFLLCDTDLPWIADNVRENGGENRLLIQKKYIEFLEKYNLKYELISGNNKTRFKSAKLKIEELLKIT